MHVTGFDVARLAGVSQPTVSRALRNLPGTSPETRERVLAAAKELSYIASDRGRALSTRMTRRIAVVSDELTNPYYAELIEPMRQALSEHDFRTVLITDGGGDEMDVDSLADGSYDGVVLTTTKRRSRLPRDLSERGVPHVLVNRLLDHPESPSVGIDNHAGSREIADLLVGLGHTKIGVVAGPIETSTGRERLEGLRIRLQSHGVRVRREFTQRCDFRHDSALQSASALLALPRPPTAIVCGNDVIALGVLSAAVQAGMRVPEDLTVIGFDDIPIAGWPLVNLTTLRSDLVELAALGVRLLVERIAGTASAQTEIRLSPRLILRGTHGPPKTF